MRKIFILSIVFQFFLIATPALAQPSRIAISKVFTDIEFTSELVAKDDNFVYTIRFLKKEKEGVIDVWRHEDMQFVKSFPLVLPSVNLTKINLLGGMVAGGELVVFVFYYNKPDNTRLVAMIQLDPNTGAVKKQSTLMAMPGNNLNRPLEYEKDVNFVYDSYTGRAAITLQEMNYREMKAMKVVKVIALDKDAKVIGTKEVELPVKRWANIYKMAITGNGQVVMQAKEIDAAEYANKFAKFLCVVDVVKGTFNTYENLDGKAQGGVIDNLMKDILQSQPDGSVVYFQPYTKKGVPDYGLSAILATVLDASGQNMTTKLMEFKERDIVKHDTKQVPYLVAMHLSDQWTADDGTWMFSLWRSDGHMDGTTHLAIVSADPKGSILTTSFYPVLDKQTGFFAAVPDNKVCWFLIGEIPANIGKQPGTFELSKTSSKWKTELVPCMVRFDGQKFGTLEALPGMKDHFFMVDFMDFDNKTGKRLIKWFYPDDKVIITEIGR